MKKLLTWILMLGLTACQTGPSKISKDDLKKLLKENPDIITDTIVEHPTAFVEAFQTAIKAAQSDMAKKRQDEEKKEFETAFENPLSPVLRADELIRGNKNAPITLVEYSDFECPFCERGAGTVKELMAKYGDKLRIIFKHLPLGFHQNAMPAAKYYEALRLQKEEWAIKFHDKLFGNAKEVKNGEKYFKSVAKELGADMNKLAKDLDSEGVAKRIEADQQEAAQFGIQGTPGFILNGVPIKGAYPLEHFEKIIEELKKRGKLTL